VNIKHIVELSDQERKRCEAMISSGKHSARKLRRVRTLLLADSGKQTAEIVDALSTSTSTVYRTKRRFVEGGLDHALTENRRPGACRKLDGTEEALLVAVACSNPPEGRARWTLQLLADKLVVLTDHEELSASTIGRRLRENKLKPWQKRMWVIPTVDAHFVASMEDVLDLYSEPHDPSRPVVSFDETPVQLIGETRTPIDATPGQTARIDYEYRRNGTANLFVFVDVHRPWRQVKTTRRRTNADFARAMRDLVDVHYPGADKIRVVLDNLSTHTAGAVYQTFPAPEARRIMRRLEFHHTPKHASWLNMVEIEIGVLARQCLDRRIPDIETLKAETIAWTGTRNASGANIEWMFDVEAARVKLGKSYPEILATDDQAQVA
jgi:transposase